MAHLWRSIPWARSLSSAMNLEQLVSSSRFWHITSPSCVFVLSMTPSWRCRRLRSTPTVVLLGDLRRRRGVPWVTGLCAGRPIGVAPIRLTSLVVAITTPPGRARLLTIAAACLPSPSRERLPASPSPGSLSGSFAPQALNTIDFWPEKGRTEQSTRGETPCGEDGGRRRRAGVALLRLCLDSRCRVAQGSHGQHRFCNKVDFPAENRLLLLKEQRSSP